MLEYYGVFLLNEITSVPSIETDIPDAGEYIGDKNSKKFHLNSQRRKWKTCTSARGKELKQRG